MQISFPKVEEGREGGSGGGDKKTCIFLVNIKLGSALKKFSFFLKGKGGGVEEGRRRTSGED